MLTPEQKAFRRRGITATDIAAILGIDPFRSGWQVQQEKRGRELFKGNLYTEAGEALEPVVARQYCRDNPGVVLHQGATVQHPEHSLLLATPDYLVDIGGGRKVLEIKSVYSWPAALEWGVFESDEIPKKFHCQVLWQMGVCRIDEADVARFYGGQVNYWRIRFNASMFADMRELALEWHEKHITRGEDCEPTDVDLEVVTEHAPKIRDGAEEPATANHIEAQALQRWRNAYFDVKAAEKIADDAAAKVLNAIGVRAGLRHESILVRFGEAKGKSTTDWLGLARVLGATPEHLTHFTKRGPSYRRPWASFWHEKEKK